MQPPLPPFSNPRKGLSELEGKHEFKGTVAQLCWGNKPDSKILKFVGVHVWRTFLGKWGTKVTVRARVSPEEYLVWYEKGPMDPAFKIASETASALTEDTLLAAEQLIARPASSSSE